MYLRLDHATAKPSGKNYTSVKPKVEPVKNSDWKKDSASYQEAPKAMCKASEDVCQPRNKTQKSNELTHHLSLWKRPSGVM
jgi:hypothetical protein